MENRSQNSKETFFTMLRSSMPMDEFCSRLAMLLDYDPWFVPGYLEQIWASEERGDLILKRELIQKSKQVLLDLVANLNTPEHKERKWCKSELEALEELLEIVLAQESMLVKFLLRRKFHPLRKDLVVSSEKTTTDTHLKLVDVLDSKPLRDEVNRADAYWWNINTNRAKEIIHHQYTHSILLRHLHDPRTEYAPVDGAHESLPTWHIEKFQHIHKSVLELAKKLQIGLGKVAIVRLQPGQQVYRHFDSEPFLKGRNRYHLVVQSGEGSILSSGIDTVNARPGEVWFFDNKVMHRAHNKSNLARIHVVFDGYPLGGTMGGH